MFHLFLWLSVLFVTIAIMVVFAVRKWEKITDVLNGIMDWASSLLGENESKSNSKKQSSLAVIKGLSRKDCRQMK